MLSFTIKKNQCRKFFTRNKKQLNESIATPATKPTYVKGAISNATKNIL